MNKPIFCRCTGCDATFSWYRRHEHDCEREAE